LSSLIDSSDVEPLVGANRFSFKYSWSYQDRWPSPPASPCRDDRKDAAAAQKLS
jgi:hypothetical protein